MASKDKRKVNRGRASWPPSELVAQVGGLVAWRPRVADAGCWVLCVATGLKFRWGHWDFQLVPVAGEGTFWAAQEFVAPAPVTQLDPAQLLNDLAQRAEYHLNGGTPDGADDHRSHPNPENGLGSPENEPSPAAAR